MKIVTSKDNSTYKRLKNLVRNHEKESLVLIEGEDLVFEAKESGRLVTVISYDQDKVEGYSDFEAIILSKELYRELASFSSLPPIMGVAKFELSDEAKGDLIYLDRVQDPGNVGTIIRTALAFGYGGVVLSPDSASPFSSKVVQASKGAIFKLPIMVKSLENLSLTNYEIIGTSLKGMPLDEENIISSNQDKILVFGNEGQGISEKVSRLCNKLYLLPIIGIDSLNVSSAASIFIYIFRRK